MQLIMVHKIVSAVYYVVTTALLRAVLLVIVPQQLYLWQTNDLPLNAYYESVFSDKRPSREPSKLY